MSSFLRYYYYYCQVRRRGVASMGSCRSDSFRVARACLRVIGNSWYKNNINIIYTRIEISGKRVNSQGRVWKIELNFLLFIQILLARAIIFLESVSFNFCSTLYIMLIDRSKLFIYRNRVSNSINRTHVYNILFPTVSMSISKFIRSIFDATLQRLFHTSLFHTCNNFFLRAYEFHGYFFAQILSIWNSYDLSPALKKKKNDGRRKV